jgi:hypothetical protein
MAMVAANYIERYKNEMAGHQKMFEQVARVKRGDFEGMTTVDLREVEKHAHKYGTPHVEHVVGAIKSELDGREEIRQREKRGIRHKQMAEDHAIRTQQNDRTHENRMRQRDELHNQEQLHKSAKAGVRTPSGQPNTAHPAGGEVMSNAQHNDRHAQTSKLQRMAQAHEAAAPKGANPPRHTTTGAPPKANAYRGKLPLSPQTGAAPAQSHMVQVRGKKGGMIEKNTETGKMHYLGRKAASQRRARTNINTAKARIYARG